MHQIYTLTPNKLNQSRHHSPVEPCLVHEAQFRQRNIHGGQLVADCSALAYAAYDRRKAPVVQPAHNAQQEIFGTANREGDKEMKDPRLAMQCGFPNYSMRPSSALCTDATPRGCRSVAKHLFHSIEHRFHA